MSPLTIVPSSPQRRAKIQPKHADKHGSPVKGSRLILQALIFQVEVMVQRASQLPIGIGEEATLDVPPCPKHLHSYRVETLNRSTSCTSQQLRSLAELSGQLPTG